MALFYTDSVTLAYANVEAATRWWVDAFECKVVKMPPEWDCPLPSDVALQLPGHDAPTILLSSKSELQEAGFDRSNPVASVLFCGKLKKGHDYLCARGIVVGPITDGGDTQLFEVHDTEGNLIEICKET